MSLKDAITIMAIFSNDIASLQMTETQPPTDSMADKLIAHHPVQRESVRDAVIDVMHALALNLIRTELEDRLLADLGANSTLHSQERLVSNGELLDRNDLSEALSKVDWTAEMKNGHLPKVCPSQSNGKHKLGYWKSEEYSRLILLK